MSLLGSASVHVVAGVALGLASAIYALDGFGLKPVLDSPNWKEWKLSSNEQLQPYAFGHFLSSGKVPTPNSARYFIRSADDAGNNLRGDCVFTLTGPVIASRWWSLSAGDTGDVTAQATLSAGQAVLNSNDQLTVTLSRQPMPGNWIRPDVSGTYNLIYVVSEPAKGAEIILPTLSKVGC